MASDNVELIDHETALAELMRDPEFAREYRMRSILTTIALQIYNARRELGLSQTDLADKIKMSRGRMRAIESGDFADLNVKTLFQIAEALGKRVVISFES